MCIFCDNIRNSDKEFIWFVRSNYSDDNSYTTDNQKFKDDDDRRFRLIGYTIDGNQYITIDYNQRIKNDDKDIIIKPFSEGIRINYCPSCGKQVSHNILDFKEAIMNRMETNFDLEEVYINE